jgi:nucleoside-diphosphate-sugar epimerase
VDARDLAQAYRLSLEALVYGKVEYDIYNLGGDEVFSNIPSLELIRKYYPDTLVLNNENGFLARPNAPLWDISKIKRELGFAPQYSWKDYESLD